MTKILAGVRVLDVTRYVAGPISTALLADLGAEVVRIEQPGGGEDRSSLPFAEGFHGGVGFTQVNRNKRGMTLDLASARGQEVFRTLLARADIVVANMPPRAVQSLKLDYESLAAIKQDIIFVHMTSFGSVGPYSDRLGFDALAQVMSGAAYLSGETGAPMKAGVAWVDMATGFLGAFATLAALRHRDATGEGQKVDLNLLQTALTVDNYFLIDQALNNTCRVGTGNRAQSGGPADLLPTKDGWVYIATLGNAQFRRWARAIGREEELTSDQRFLSDEKRAENGEALSAIAAEWSRSLTTEQLLSQTTAHRIPAAPLLSPQQALDDPHIASTFIQPLRVDGLSKPVPYVRSPATFSKTPAEIYRGPPAPGEHTNAVLEEHGFTAEEIERLRAERVV